MQIHNCHIHTLTLDHVPIKFIPFGLSKLLAKYKFTTTLTKLLKNVIPFNHDDLFDHYSAFLQIGSKKTQKEIFENVSRCYPDDTKFIIHSLDLAYMGCQDPRKSFIDQLDELVLLKKEFPEQVMPFIFADPRRPNLLDIVKKYIEEYGFSGIKIYPALGYYPDDERLKPLWKYLESKKLPVTAHCSKGGIYNKSEISKIVLLLREEHRRLVKGSSKRDICNIFSHPNNYHRMLQEFPNLNVCLAHFGGDTEWERYMDDSPDINYKENWFNIIKNIVKVYPNAYTDLAYTMQNNSLCCILKVHLSDINYQKKILFGSDYYMVQQSGHEKQFSIDLRCFLGEELFTLISETNPKEFLKRL